MARWIRTLAVPLALGAAALVLAAARVRNEAGLAPLEARLRGEELCAGDAVFDPAMVDGLPAPARRFLLRAIAPGAPLARAAEIRMHGTIRLRPERDPVPMRAEQLLAPRQGYVWKARVGRGLVRIRGYDRFSIGGAGTTAASGTGEGVGEGAMRWWLWGLVPVVRAEGDDLARSAAGRAAGESVLVPSLLLPSAGAEWEPVDDATARVTVPIGRARTTLTLAIDPDGRLLRADFDRWNGDPANGPVGWTPFGVETDGELSAGGYTVPSRMRAGWRLGQPDENAFFDATLDEVRFR